VELRHLEYFIAVAEELSFTGAAARMYVAQSAVSAGIKALERELEVLLFERTSRRVHLSDAGAAFLPHAYATLDAARGARDALSQVQGGLRGTVRVGTMTSVGIIDLPELLGDFHRQYPGVLLQLSAAPSGSQGLVESVIERRLDLAFVSIPNESPPQVTLTALGREPMDLVLPAGHPLAQASAVAVADLADYDFIDSPVGYGNRAVTDRAFASTGTTRRVTIEVTDIATAPAYVRHGLGIALLPRFALHDIQDLAVLPVTGADLGWPMSLATPKNRSTSAAAAALVKMIQDRAA
jgi:DNA-binding transcriptional LysR family regulator